MVIDASLAVAIALAGTGLGTASRGRIAGPSLMWSEAASALRQLVWRGEIDQADALMALGWLLTAPIESHDSRDLIEDASRLAGELGWAKTHDAEYVALARRLQIPLATADARLRQAAGRVVEVIAPTEV